MGVVNSNSNGPLSANTSLFPVNSVAVQNAILMELRNIAYILRQAYGINDSPAGFQQSETTTDLNTTA